MSLDDKYSIIPSTGVFGSGWPSHFNLPQGEVGGLSTAGWTADNPSTGNFGNEGFIQQTFLGASITNFDLNAGFGDTSSTLTVQLVNDEFNTSDGLGLGQGDDVYHNGVSDTFKPPVVGSPVFFKFGKNPATVDQAFRQTFDNLYNTRTLPDKTNSQNAWGYPFPRKRFDRDEFKSIPQYHVVDLAESVIEDRSALWDNQSEWRGRNHFVFGGILQSYTQNKGPNGITFNVNVSDPREILSSVEVLLNNYQGTVFNHKNIINVYGFLEYDPSDKLMQQLKNARSTAGIINKFVNSQGVVQYVGLESKWDTAAGWEKIEPLKITPNLKDQYEILANGFPRFFPITGQGFSRRTDKGIPWYRVSQALTAMFEYFGPLPGEYVNAGFGGRINFRGFNYVVDFGGIPTEKIPLLYYIDFDKIDLLSLAQELCEIISHELYVTLLPIIDHPACSFLYNYNQSQITLGQTQNLVAGIIRLDAIDKTAQPRYGAIKAYIDELAARGATVENQDVGFELSNVTTDKFVVGGQEVDMYLFSTERDRDDLWTSTRENNPENLEKLSQLQWDLETQASQQVLPYYGKLGKDAVSIPRGFGSYQQILLDASELNAYGVGNYYVATELELRAALVSYEAWKDFLLSYNDVYIEDISDISLGHDILTNDPGEVNGVVDKALSQISTILGQIPEKVFQSFEALRGRKFAVTVPRCVWDSDKPIMGEDGYPASPCSPPFGYPLYYKRATKIGIVEAGLVGILNTKTRLVSDVALLKKQVENASSPLLSLDQSTADSRLNGLRSQLHKLEESGGKGTDRYKELLDQINSWSATLQDFEKIKQNIESTSAKIAQIEDLSKSSTVLFNIENTARKHNENAKRVYDFVRKIAEECLGRKFLVRLPRSCNLNYSHIIKTFNQELNFNIKNGPFGFPPRPINDSSNFQPSSLGGYTRFALHYDYLSKGSSNKYTNGAIKGNYNPFSENWEWNYKPEPQGGFYSSSLFGTNLTALDYFNGNIPYSSLPSVIRQGLLPIDYKKLLTDSNRLTCYVKYNNSHFLDFTGVGSDDIVQQSINEAGEFVPDVIEGLFNYNINAETNYNIISQTNDDRGRGEAREPSVAFIKCSVDEKLYMPPKLKRKATTVWASNYELTFSTPELTIADIFDAGGCPKSEVALKQFPIFSIPSGAPGKSINWVDFSRKFDPYRQAWIVDADASNLDSEYVYALITVPGRIKSTADVRWKDGPAQAYQTVQKKHLMLQDIVRIPEFSQPAIPASAPPIPLRCNPPLFNTPQEASTEAGALNLVGFHQRGDKFAPGQPRDWINLTLGDVSRGREIARKLSVGFTLAQPSVKLGYTSPSPVFPDVVALPLMSMERCYGPWLSAGGAGGKVEFIKDENLSPWNYAGYQLLNEAGSLQSQFSSSLLLWSERGGFVVPDAPTGLSLATALKEGGPLVTSISIAVDPSNGVKTTVKLDLYTSKFGKLQKQKEMAIGQISRERQRLLDEKNNALRRGLGKKQSSLDLVNTVMQAGGDQILQIAGEVAKQITTNAGLSKNPDPMISIYDSNNNSTNMTKEQMQVTQQALGSPLGQASQMAVDTNRIVMPYGTDFNTTVGNLSANIGPLNEILNSSSAYTKGT
jgi:hypothetical protein